ASGSTRSPARRRASIRCRAAARSRRAAGSRTRNAPRATSPPLRSRTGGARAACGSMHRDKRRAFTDGGFCVQVFGRSLGTGHVPTSACGERVRMGRLSTHVLDMTIGRPAAGVTIALARRSGNAWTPLKSTVTNADGRTDQPLLEGEALTAARYRLEFHIGGDL